MKIREIIKASHTPMLRNGHPKQQSNHSRKEK